MSSFLNKTVIFKEASGGAPGMNSIMYAEDQHDYAEDSSFVNFSEDDEAAEAGSADVFLFSEEEGAHPMEEDLLDMTLEEALAPFVKGEGSFEEIADEADELQEDVEELIEDHGEKTLSDLLPGAGVSSDELVGEKEERETDYANDKDLTKFMDHVTQLYPAKIPAHDGTSTVGCERAISFLDRLNRDISGAIREDHENILDMPKLEDIRLNIMRDVMVLKDHLGKLKRQIRDSHDKKASIPNWVSPRGKVVSYGELKKSEELKKEAGTPNNMVIAVSPFERAISGMMINAHVSAGHPMEEVYAL